MGRLACVANSHHFDEDPDQHKRKAGSASSIENRIRIRIKVNIRKRIRIEGKCGKEIVGGWEVVIGEVRSIISGTFVQICSRKSRNRLLEV